MELLKAEKRIRRKEETKGQGPPASATDFERLLLTAPACSYLWIQYAAFLVSQKNISDARDVLNRAIKQIDIAEEREKANLYIALVNLEAAHGDEDALSNAFEKAALHNDPQRILNHKLRVYAARKDEEEVESTHRFICKKYGANVRNWVGFIEFLRKNASKDTEDVEAVISRAEKSLPRAQLVEFRKQLGLIEYKYGNSERARTIFETLVSEHPKRADIWHVYIDAEAKASGNHKEILDRVFTVSWSSRKLKSFEDKCKSLEFEINK